jgi:hypothetical protein
MIVLLMRKDNKPIRVVKLANLVKSEWLLNSKETVVMEEIIAMAQKYVASNNCNLLEVVVGN